MLSMFSILCRGSEEVMQVMGQTGAVSPGLCGTARAATEGEEQAWSIWCRRMSGGFGFRGFIDHVLFWREALVLEWEPPNDNGGADLVAYRQAMWKRTMKSWLDMCDICSIWFFVLFWFCLLPMSAFRTMPPRVWLRPVFQEKISVNFAVTSYKLHSCHMWQLVIALTMSQVMVAGFRAANPQDGLGGFFPASNYIDLGLFEHAGDATATQRAPVKCEAKQWHHA